MERKNTKFIKKCINTFYTFSYRPNCSNSLKDDKFKSKFINI